MIEGKKIMVSGFAGSIGSELFRQLAPYNELYGLDIDETRMFDLLEELKLKGHKVSGRVGDIKAHSTVEDAVSSFMPDLIFNCAARKHVTPMEWNPMEAVQTNVIGTYNLLKYSKKYGVKKFVNISTDKASVPNCVMGATKRVAELMVKNAGEVSVRFGNVLNSRGSLLPFWQGQIDRGEPITVTDVRMERYMMSTTEACSLVIKAAEIGEPGDIILLDMGKPVKIMDLAHKIVAELKKDGREVPIEIIGMRKGEVLKERLMSEEEEKMAVKKEQFHIINEKNLPTMI